MNSKSFILFLAIIVIAVLQLSFAVNSNAVDATIAYFNKEATAFAADAATLKSAIAVIDTNDKKTVNNAIGALVTCRNQYKKISFFLEYFFPSESHMFNAAPVTEVEDAELEFIEPIGLQQIENLLYQHSNEEVIKELKIQGDAIFSSAADIRSLLYEFSATDAQLLESLRIELVRILTLYITGYDAPSLKTGIVESQTAVTAMHKVLNNYIPLNPVEGNKLSNLLTGAEQYLQSNNNFDQFSRMKFLRQHGLPLQASLGAFIRSLGMELNTSGYVNYSAQNIFSRGALNTTVFKTTFNPDNDTVRLGQMLFSETALSVNNTRSCATCHNPELYFNDMLPKSASLTSHKSVKRNAPTLLYSGLQHAQFWDGRAASMPEQIRSVIIDIDEMNGNEHVIMHRLAGKRAYMKLFQKLFPGKTVDSLGLHEVANAIASYVQSLAPMNSAFDKYIQGDDKAMDAEQVKGFDLFMGKAKCATCHFAPVFNSLLPPYYNVSEYEVIGTTANEDLAKPLKDMDRGRFTSYPVKYYDGAFKTPTVRNAAKTAPYMHNGAFASLDSVIAFYDRGGGDGLGLTNNLQTLSSEHLNLTPAEQKQLIQFINALTDELPTKHSKSNPK